MLEVLGSVFIDWHRATATVSHFINVPAMVTRSSDDCITSLAPGKAPTFQLCNLPKPPVGSEALSWVVFQGTLHLGNRGTDVRVQCEIAAFAHRF
jgi:hypothetical protein